MNTLNERFESAKIGVFKTFLIFTATIVLVAVASGQISQSLDNNGNLVFEDASSNELLNISGSGSMELSGGLDMPNGIILGESAEATDDVSVAIGKNSYADGGAAGASTAVGLDANASQAGNSAFGDEAEATGQFASAFGGGSMAPGQRSTAIGILSNATSQYSTSLGMYSWVKDEAGTALGYNAQAFNFSGIAIGAESKSRGYASTVIGTQSNTSGDRATVVGSIADAGTRSVSFGSEANGSVARSVALGQMADVIGPGAGGIAIGRDAMAQGSGIAIGEEAFSDENRTAVFGGGIYDYNLNVTGNLSVEENLEVYGGTKNFVEEMNETHEIVYTSSESGEVVVEWSDAVTADSRGVEVEFPGHLSEVMSSEEDYHVLATPVDSMANTGVFNKTDSGFTLKASEESEIDFHVRGVREGFEDKEVVREK